MYARISLVLIFCLSTLYSRTDLSRRHSWYGNRQQRCSRGRHSSDCDQLRFWFFTQYQ